MRQGRHRREWRGRENARVLRGGSWNNNERGNAGRDSAHLIAERKLHGGRSRNLLSSNRHHNTPTNRNNNNGFRCVMVPGSAPKPAATLGAAPGGASSPVRAKTFMPRERQFPSGATLRNLRNEGNQTNPRPRVLEKMKQPEHNAGIHQEKDAAATVVTGRWQHRLGHEITVANAGQEEGS